MSSIRDRIETGFESFGHRLYRHPFIAIAASLLFVGLMVMHLPKTTVDTTTEGFLFDDDPVRVAYDDFRKQFGRDERVMIAVGPVDVFSFPVITKLKALHEALEAKVPYLDEVTSLINVRNTYGKGDLVGRCTLHHHHDRDQRLCRRDRRRRCPGRV